MPDNQKLALFYYQITDVWKRFCEEHYKLFEVTSDEYTCLLASNIEDLEQKLADKGEIIARINVLESIRSEIIEEINHSKISNETITNVSELISFFLRSEEEMKYKHLEKFNLLLIDLIEKIQAQNKKNQLFINKAILSLKEIRESASGEKNFKTYNAKGATANTSGRKE